MIIAALEWRARLRARVHDEMCWSGARLQDRSILGVLGRYFVIVLSLYPDAAYSRFLQRFALLAACWVPPAGCRLPAAGSTVKTDGISAVCRLLYRLPPAIPWAGSN